MPSFEEFVEQSETATTICQLKARFRRVMASEGFENHFVGRIVGRKVSETYWVEFPKGHFETYVAEAWEDVDPILAWPDNPRAGSGARTKVDRMEPHQIIRRALNWVLPNATSVPQPASPAHRPAAGQFHRASSGA